MRTIGIVCLLCCLVVPWQAQAGESPQDTTMQTEVAYLFTFLGASDCRFYRNGSWHTPAEAVKHLRMKYDYLHRKNLVHSAEQFIKRGASESSWSGLDYKVQCAKQPEVTSANWFTAALQQFRASKP
ncbi:MAG: DUF5329 domain-containing protein [Mariprofundaceae bacterium]|nr:DUF5329 domain-containing protein [Mariprofundaceae bacterium]